MDASAPFENFLSYSPADQKHKILVCGIYSKSTDEKIKHSNELLHHFWRAGNISRDSLRPNCGPHLIQVLRGHLAPSSDGHLPVHWELPQDNEVSYSQDVSGLVEHTNIFEPGAISWFLLKADILMRCIECALHIQCISSHCTSCKTKYQ